MKPQPLRSLINPSPIRLGFLVFLSLAIGIAPFYTLASSDRPVVWLILLSVATLAIFIFFTRFLDQPIIPLQICLIIYLLQNLLIGILNPEGLSDVVPLLLGYSVLVPLLIFVSSVRKDSWKKLRQDTPVHILAILYSSYIILLFFQSSWPMAARLPALRNSASAVILFYSAFILTKIGGGELLRFKKFILGFSLMIAAFGLLDQFVLGDVFWEQTANIELIMEAKYLRPSSASDFVIPSDFYSPISGIYFRRMASLFATPITTGYFLAFGAILFFPGLEKRQWKKWAIFGVMLIGLLLTLSKGALQIAAIGIGIHLLIGRFRLEIFKSYWLLFLASILIAIGSIWVINILPFGSTANVHLEGLMGPIENLRTSTPSQILFGNELGSGGSISGRLGVSGPHQLERGAESGIGALLYQTGLTGVFLYTALLVAIASALYRRVLQYPDPSSENANYYRAVFAAIIGLLVNSFFQENALALIPASIFYFSAGLGLASLNNTDSLTGEK